MRLESAHDGHVLNVEAREILLERRAVRDDCKARDRRLDHADAVMTKALRYLDVKSPAAGQRADKVEACAGILAGDTLPKLKFEERLQILNHAPAAPVVVHLLVADCESRLADDQVDQVITLSNNYLRAPPAATAAAAADAAEGAS